MASKIKKQLQPFIARENRNPPAEIASPSRLSQKVVLNKKRRPVTRRVVDKEGVTTTRFAGSSQSSKTVWSVHNVMTFNKSRALIMPFNWLPSVTITR